MELIASAPNGISGGSSFMICQLSFDDDQIDVENLKSL